MTGKLDVVLWRAGDAPVAPETGTGLGAEQQAWGGGATDRFEQLLAAWPQVLARLRNAVEQEADQADTKGIRLDSVEFQIGVESGLSIGLTAKGNASVTVTFKRG